MTDAAQEIEPSTYDDGLFSMRVGGGKLGMLPCDDV